MSLIPLDKIKIDGGTQSRESINEDLVAEYAEAMKNSAAFPAVDLFHDGNNYWLADGFHRFHATKRVGSYEIVANVHQGSQRDAILYSFGANAVHGERRNNNDKNRAVTAMLADAEWVEWSDREIARICGVSHSFVNGVRKSNCKRRTDSGLRKAQRGDSIYTIDTSNIGQSSPPCSAETDAPEAGKASENSPEVSENSPALAETSAFVDVFTSPEVGENSPEVSEISPEVREIARRYDALSDEARRSDWIDLNLEIIDLRKTVSSQSKDIGKLSGQISDLSQQNQGAVISKLQAQLNAANLFRNNAMASEKNMEYRMKVAFKERDVALAKLQREGEVL